LRLCGDACLRGWYPDGAFVEASGLRGSRQILEEKAIVTIFLCVSILLLFFIVCFGCFVVVMWRLPFARGTLRLRGIFFVAVFLAGFVSPVCELDALALRSSYSLCRWAWYCFVVGDVDVLVRLVVKGLLSSLACLWGLDSCSRRGRHRDRA
jgi:hypothetical protein